jgi:cysteine synthase
MLQARAVSEPRKCCPDIIGVIGHTPLVELKRIAPKENVRLFAKLEF